MLLILVLGPMVAAVIGYLIGRKNRMLRDYFADIITIVEFIMFLFLCFKVLNGETITFRLNDFCARGLYFKLDGFRVIYGTIAALMWMMTSIFSRQYFAHYHNRNRYYLFYLMTLGATVGVLISADLFTTFIFFEIMSFTSYVWVAHDEEKEALKAAATYLAVAVIGGMVMLMGLFLLYNAVGTLEFDELLTACANYTNKTVLYIAGGCMLFGFGAKAGMFPLHIWLPKAHPVAPAPASALLSGILTKTGIFGIIVISSNIFLHDANWGIVILILGTITMVGGALLAVFSINLKRTLACSSMSQIGFILIGIGMQGLLGEHNALAVRGTVLHMVNHSLFKLVLFMAAGVVFMNLHKLDLNSIRGFGRKKPALMFAFAMGALGISGVPLFNGYISKTLLHESIVEYTEMVLNQDAAVFFHVIEWVFLISGGLTTAYMLKLFVAIFIEKNEKQEEMDQKKHYMNAESTFALVGSAIILPVLGIFPNLTMDKLADAAQGFMYGHGTEHSVHYFNGTNLKGGLISLAIGALVYFGFIRTCLMKKENGVKVYKNYWPFWLDMEEYFYKPVFFVFLPFIGAFICRIADRFVDAVAKVIANTILRPARNHKPIEVGTRFTYTVGSIMDDVVGFLNRSFLRKRPIEKSYVKLLAVSRTEVTRTSRLVTRSVSFGLLLFCIGLMLTLAYLFIVI